MKHISKVLFIVFMMATCASQAQMHELKKLFSQQKSVKEKNAGWLGKVTYYPDSIESYSFDPFQQVYSPDRHQCSYPKYDANGNRIELIVRLIGSPSNDSKYQASYTNGILTETLISEWNAATKQWDPNRKYTYHLNRFGVDSAEEYATYNSQENQWELESTYLTVIDYDGSDRPISTIYMEYTVASQTWDIYERLRFNYQGSASLPSEIYVDEEDGQGGWNEVFFAENLKWDLGFNGNLDDFEPTLLSGSEWNGSNWEKSFYDSSIVDQGNVIEEHSFNYDNQAPVLSYTGKYVFDAQSNRIYREEINWENGISDTLLVDIDSFEYGPNLEIQKHVNVSYSYLGSRTEYRYKEIYYYGNTGLESKSSPSLMVYPNPISAQDLLLIEAKNELKQVQLIALDGRVVKEWNTELNNGISMEGLNQGLYFIRAMDQAGVAYSGRVQVN